ncbi:fasciclin domain-containing protein [Spirosoma pollinicola]|uniref:Beta-Ig-H3/fasciclin n=1 Tax=Spirosoma pollinicola TaxID=2057025 RepID=A0A2K8YUD0_9BACT|nr:fasciclin domain-containing protein [Spirosoma pollinicola]AUD01242.1 beta-Ig-H3/fasciclin [Spirosoma pollinicola]
MNSISWMGIRRISVILFLLVALVNCKKGDDTVAVPPTITDRILEDSQFGLLRFAMLYSETGDVLKGGNLTLFAPNDAAFQASGLASPAAISALSKEQVKAILLYHVLYGSVSASAIPAGQNAVVTASKGVAYVNKSSDGKIFVNNAQVIQADIAVANGYIHSIDRLLTPATGNLLTTIQNTPNLTFLTAAVGRVGASNPALLTTLNNESSTNRVTVFAPNDAAFMAAGYNDLAAINSANLQVLTNILLYHVVPGVTFSNQLQTGSLNTLLTGNKVTITATANQITLKGNKNNTVATIKQADLPTTNGVIHIIDQVLQP